MNRQRLGPWLPAFGAALVTLFAGPAFALSSAELRDVPPTHWAYRSIQQLVNRYGVMSGFPDATFRGDKTLTRYELAAALQKVMQRIDAASQGRAPAATPTAPLKPSDADRAALDKLRKEFASELARLDEQVQKHDDVLKQLGEKLEGLGAVKFSGGVSTTFADETLDVGKDRSAAYITSGFGLSMSGNVGDASSFSASVGGTFKASGAGDRPGVLGGGPGAQDNYIRLNSASYRTKVGATTVALGRVGMRGVGTDLGFKTGDFMVGVGETWQDASQLRTGSDIGTTVSSQLGAVKIFGGVNSNILLSVLEFSAGPFRVVGGYETDHAAITQNLLGSGPRVKTTDNAAIAFDVGNPEGLGLTLQANATNLALTHYGGGLRARLADIDMHLIGMVTSPPDQSVTVASFGPMVLLPKRHLFGPVHLPEMRIAATDNFTITAPPRADGQPTTGAGGQALGRNAGVSLQVGLENPIVPNLVAEYNVQAKLIENIFVPNANDPITSESIVLRSSLDF